MPKKIVVSIDLGTSRSACAYSIQGRAEEDVIIHIPKGSLASVSAMKTETAVLLGGEHHEFQAFGRAARERFIEEAEDEEDECGGWLDESGHDVRQSSTCSSSSMLFRWFKAVLCQRRGYQSIDDPVATDDGGRKVPLMRVMTLVLAHFKEDILRHLSTVSEVPQTVEDVTWALTIPAIYDDFAKRFMRVAAHKAGIIPTVDSSNLQLCLEPEAACLAISIKDAPHFSRVGTKTLILDCGGGTIDITTHEVLSTSPLRLKEVLPPTGGPWGSTCVDNEFMRWCQEFLGDDEYARVRRTSAFYNLLTQWEQGKTAFGDEDTERVRLNMVDIARQLNLDANMMQVRHLQGFFSSIIHMLHGAPLPLCVFASGFRFSASGDERCIDRREACLGGCDLL